MKKANAWEIIKTESDTIIKAIEKGEIKCRKEMVECAGELYNYRVAEAIAAIVDAYIIFYNINLPYSTDEQ